MSLCGNLTVRLKVQSEIQYRPASAPQVPPFGRGQGAQYDEDFISGKPRPADGELQKSFDRDVDRIKDKKLLRRLRTLISMIENAETIHEILHIKKIEGYEIILPDKNWRLSVRYGGNL